MEPLCEFCGMVRALVYCKSDSARLCLRCDNFVHSANCLTRRHPRSLLCDECNSQPAIVRCVDEKMSLCQDCDSWNGNGPNGCSGIWHSRQTLSCYSGCPSQDEFSKICFSVLDVPRSCGGFDAIWDPSTTLPINENWRSHSLKPNGNEGSVSVGLVTDKLNELQPCSKFDPLIAPSSVMPFNQNCLPPRSTDQGNSSYKNLEIHDTEYPCDELNVDDAALSFESCVEMFGSLQGHSKYNFDDGRTDCQIMEKTVSVTESNGHVEKALEPCRFCLGIIIGTTRVQSFPILMCCRVS